MQRRAEKDPLHRQVLSLRICKVRKRARKRTHDLRCAQAVNAPRVSRIARTYKIHFSRGTASQQEEIEDDLVCMCKSFCGFYTDLFKDEIHDALPAWISMDSFGERLDHLPRLDGEMVRCSIPKMHKGKSCGTDLSVVQVLQELNADVLKLLEASFMHCWVAIVRAINLGGAHLVT